jgi:hypothetical protein
MTTTTTLDCACLDPATPSKRRELARGMLIGAARRYEEVSEEWTRAHESYPNLESPREPIGPAEVAERKAWRSLLGQSDDDFNHAEEALAHCIQRLYDMLAPADRRTCASDGEYFVPRAVRSEGRVYVLSYSAHDYEPRTNIIAVYRESLVIDLAVGEDD